MRTNVHNELYDISLRREITNYRAQAAVTERQSRKGTLPVRRENGTAGSRRELQMKVLVEKTDDNSQTESYSQAFNRGFW